MSNPMLVDEYVRCGNYVGNYQKNGKIDLSSLGFVNLTTLVPLCSLITSNAKNYIPPNNNDVSMYVDTIIGGTGSSTYSPLVDLPKDKTKREEALQKVYRLQQNDPFFFGGEDAFKYVVHEMTDNIYEHSNFSRATIASQKYKSAGYVDLCIHDNGITIPASLGNKGHKFEPHKAIAEAINGLSAKDDSRGFGLRTSVRLCLEGLHGEILVVSGAGAVHFEGTTKTLYNLTGSHVLKGTLVSLRVPLVTSKIDIYDYVE